MVWCFVALESPAIRSYCCGLTLWAWQKQQYHYYRGYLEWSRRLWFGKFDNLGSFRGESCQIAVQIVVCFFLSFLLMGKPDFVFIGSD